MGMTARRFVVTLAVLTLVATACSRQSPIGSRTSATGPSGPIDRPTGPDELVVRVDEGPGGFTGDDPVPNFSLYGDGRVVLSCGHTDTPIPCAREGRVTEAEIGALLDRARATGVIGQHVTYGDPGVTDHGTTSVFVNAAGMTYTASAYALGFDDDRLLSRAEKDARTRLTEFIAALPKPGDTMPYQYDHLGVRIIEARGSDVVSNVTDWPLGDLASTGSPVSREARCAVLSGADLNRVTSVLPKEGDRSVWRSEGKLWSLTFAPLLPDQKACDEAFPF